LVNEFFAVIQDMKNEAELLRPVKTTRSGMSAKKNRVCYPYPINK